MGDSGPKPPTTDNRGTADRGTFSRSTLNRGYMPDVTASGPVPEDPSPMQSRRPPAGPGSKPGSPAKKAQATPTSIRYSVIPVGHKVENLCAWDSLTMVARYKEHVTALAGFPFGKTARWRGLLSETTQRDILRRGSSYLHTGETVGGVRNEAMLNWGFAELTIDKPDPASFLSTLQQHGPFVYVGNTRERNLAGQPLRHAVTVTGIESRKSLSYVYYNDPADAKAHHKEFYKFLLWLMPLSRKDAKFLRKDGAAWVMHLDAARR